VASVVETVQIAARVPVELRDQLEALAEEQDRSMSWVVRRAIREYVEAQEKEAA
jgi:predicted transcriptional regulator